MNFQIFNRKFELIAFNDIEDLRKLIEEGEDLAIKIEVINDLI
jgi:acetylornithine/succinyldiaminopimelate/putrescine aminotransferase